METYGQLGGGFIEAHHTIPVSELLAKAKTKISDFTLVCSNCHGILHRGEELLSVSELIQIVRIRASERASKQEG